MFATTVLDSVGSLSSSLDLPFWFLCVVASVLIFAFVLACGYLFKLLVFAID